MHLGHPFIVLEGLSGSGKTTIGALLAERLGAHFYTTPPDSYRRIRDGVDSGGVLAARYLFYLAALFHASHEIRQLRLTRPVVCDRWALTTECFHRVAGLEIPYCHLDLPLERPTLQVLVDTPESVRQGRLDTRGLSFNDRWERLAQLERPLLAQYRLHGIAQIGNGSTVPEDAVRAVLELLSSSPIGRLRACRPAGQALSAAWPVETPGPAALRLRASPMRVAAGVPLRSGT